MSGNERSQATIQLAQTALMAALCYIGFQFLRIDIPIGGDKTAIHLGNAFCVLGALLLGGLKGGLAGAVGMTIADLTSGYADSAPRTFFMKLMIGLIVGLVAHHAGHLSQQHEPAKVFRWSFLGALAGMAFNVIVDPICSYLYNRFLLGNAEVTANILAKWTAVSTLVNAVAAILIAVTLYSALVPILRRTGLLASPRT
ncbi:MAG: ECF transporter S component [Lachnospirales bacterium]